MPNDDATTDTSDVNNVALRYLIREAVEREVSLALPSYIQQVQIAIGQSRQLNQDYGKLNNRVDDIEELLKGNPDRGIRGLVPTVADLASKLSDINSGLKLAKWLLGIMVALGASDALGITTYVQQLLGIIPQ